MNQTELLALVDQYHITDRRLVRARAELNRLPGERTEREFRKEALRYFSALAKEAREHLAEVDRRLDDLYQRQYNLHAERAVVERRLKGALELERALTDQG